MKKTIVVLLIMMNIVSVNASSNDPKDDLIKDYKDWIKSVDDVDQALADHQKDYQAKYYNGEYTIVLGAGKGKELTGTLKASYCVSSKEIKKKSFFAELFS